MEAETGQISARSGPPAQGGPLRNSVETIGLGDLPQSRFQTRPPSKRRCLDPHLRSCCWHSKPALLLSAAKRPFCGRRATDRLTTGHSTEPRHTRQAPAVRARVGAVSRKG